MIIKSVVKAVKKTRGPAESRSEEGQPGGGEPWAARAGIVGLCNLVRLRV